MRRLKIATLALCLIGISAYAQSFKGIKIISSTFDQKTRQAKLVFVNDTPNNITAIGQCVHTENWPDDMIGHGACILRDATLNEIYKDVTSSMRGRSREEMPDFTDYNFVHPGEEKTLTWDYSGEPGVANASIDITLLAYSDGTVELGPQKIAADDLADLIGGRRAALDEFQGILEICQRILSHADDKSPLATMVQEMEDRAEKEPWLKRTLKQLKDPAANGRHVTPGQERQFLAHYALEQQHWIAQLTKHQIPMQARGGTQ